MEFRQLEVFAAVAETKSFSKAAQYLYLTQSTVSTHMKKLEEELQTKLIVRSTRSLRLTPEGAAFFWYVRRILETKEAALEAISSPAPAVFHLGASTIPSGYLLPRILANFRQKHPLVYFDIRQGDSDSILGQILDGTVELGVIGKKADSSQCESIPFCEDELVLAMPATAHYKALLKQKEPLARLLQEPLIVREQGSGTQKAADRLFASRKLSASDLCLAATVNDPEAIRQMIKNGLGVSVMSKFCVRECVEQGQMLAYPLNGLVSRRFYLVYLKSRPPRPILQELIDLIRREYGDS